MKPLWDLRVLHVERAVQLTPRIRRITLTGEQLQDFPDGTHLKLLIPPAGVVPQWPVQDETGKAVWPPDPFRPTMRTYTLRHLRPEEQEIDVDVVLHGKGIASQWAASLQGGEVVGVIPPGRGSTYLQPASEYLLVGDHCALPAISVALEKMPVEAKATVMVLLPDPAEAVFPGSKAKLHFLFENEGKTQQDLLDLACRFAWEQPAQGYLWVGGESRLVSTLRKHAQQAWGFGSSQGYALGYWKAGMNETRYSNEFGYDFQAR